MLSGIMLVLGLLVMKHEKITGRLHQLEPREFLFFTYMFHMLLGERSFAYLGFEPLFVTEIVIAALALLYAKDLLQVRKILVVYYLIVLTGILFAFAYVADFKVNALRDSLLLIYAVWVPIVYHVFRRENLYELFIVLLKVFIVIKAFHYVYDATLIFLGLKAVTFEGFRFGVGYIMPALIVISIFLPLKHFGWTYKLLSLIMFPAVFTIFHRSIFLGLFVAAGIIFLIGGRRTQKTILAYGFTGLGLLTIFLIYYNSVIDVNIFNILEAKSSMDEGNINYRMLSWQTVMEKFYTHALLGYGVGRPVMYEQFNLFYETLNVSYFDLRNLGGNVQPHNSYIHILARYGIFVFPLFLYAIFRPLFQFAKYIQSKKRNHMEAYVRFLLLCGFLFFMYVFAFFNVVLESPHHSFPYWLAIGMLLSYGRAGNFSPAILRIKRED